MNDPEFPYPAKQHPNEPGTVILTHHFATDRKARLAGFEVVREIGPETHIKRKEPEDHEP